MSKAMKKPRMVRNMTRLPTITNRAAPQWIWKEDLTSAGLFYMYVQNYGLVNTCSIILYNLHKFKSHIQGKGLRLSMERNSRL